MPTIIVLGTGTGIGKTFVTCSLARALARAYPHTPIVAVKPIESGCSNPPDPTSDCAMLALASHPPLPVAPPPYALPDPLSPHLAARRIATSIEIQTIKSWVDQQVASARHVTPHIVTPGAATYCPVITSQCNTNEATGRLTANASEWNNRPLSIVETAGAVFSPLGPNLTNLELAQAFPSALWILVAPDRLGILHDLTTTLFAMKHRGRLPDLVVLSQPDPNDPSIGSNAEELATLAITSVCATIPHGGDAPPQLLAAVCEALARLA